MPITARLVTTVAGRVNYGSGGTVALLADPWPGQDLAPAVQSTERVEVPFEIGPSSPDAHHKLVLRVSADALQGPLVGLYGSMRIWVQQVDDKGGFTTVQSVSVGTLEPYEPDARGASSDVDWLRQCSPGVDCEIPLALDMRTVEGPIPSGGHAATVPDYYRWAVEVTLIALDGRSLPADALHLDPS